MGLRPEAPTELHRPLSTTQRREDNHETRRQGCHYLRRSLRHGGSHGAHVRARSANVVIADVLEHEGRQVADAIGGSARFEPLDVTQEESWAAVVAATTGHFGKLDVLVNNAGISGSAEQDFYSTEAWHRIMAVNTTG